MFTITKDKLGNHIQMDLGFAVIQSNGSTLGEAVINLSNRLWVAAWCGIPSPTWLNESLKKEELEASRDAIKRYGDKVLEKDDASLVFTFRQQGGEAVKTFYNNADGLDTIMKRYADGWLLEGVTLTRNIKKGMTLDASYFPDDLDDYESFRICLSEASRAIILWAEAGEIDLCKEDLDRSVCILVLDELGKQEQSA